MRSPLRYEIIKYNIQLDHIHMLIMIPPSYKVSEVVGRIKCKITSKLSKKFSYLSKVYWKENIFWSTDHWLYSSKALPFINSRIHAKIQKKIDTIFKEKRYLY